jgi:hypothetical protein
MPESTAIDLSVEDVSTLTWDELSLLMRRKDQAGADYDPHNEYVPDTYIPPCATFCCSFCVCTCSAP